MSFETQPTFVHHSDWDARSRAHPAMDFMEQYTHRFDSGLATMGAELPKWHTSDFEYITPAGERISGVEAAFAKLAETYGPLTQYHHEPFYLACHEADGAKGDYIMIGLATVYANTPGEKAGAGVKDGKGREWEASLPGAFRFYYRQDKDGVAGYRLAKTEIFSDSGPIVKLLLAKKVLTVEQLGLA